MIPSTPGGFIESVAILLRQLAENIKTLPDGAALDASVDAYTSLCYAITETTGATITALMDAKGTDPRDAA